MSTIDDYRAQLCAEYVIEAAFIALDNHTGIGRQRAKLRDQRAHGERGALVLMGCQLRIEVCRFAYIESIVA